jgi:hypothetical protein
MTQQEARELINEVGKKIAIFISLVSIAIIVGQFGLWICMTTTGSRFMTRRPRVTETLPDGFATQQMAIVSRVGCYARARHEEGYLPCRVHVGMARLV